MDEWVAEDVRRRKDVLVGYRMLRTSELRNLRLGNNTFLQAFTMTEN
jgi:hypothetical protein